MSDLQIVEVKKNPKNKINVISTLEGAAFLKNEDILNTCKQLSDCIVGDDYTVYTYNLKNSQLNTLVVDLKKIIPDSMEINIRIASKEAIQKILDKSNDILLFNNDIDSALSATGESKGKEELEKLLKEAHDKKISDIHIFIKEQTTHIKIRSALGMVDYSVNTGTERGLGMRLGGVIFGTLAQGGSNGFFMPAEANDNAFTQRIDAKDYRYRASTVPIKGGCKIVIRAIDPISSSIPTLQELGFNETQVDLLMLLASLPSGSVIVTGKTGSGKTTTLMSLLNLMPTSRSVHTLEDPIEMVIPKIAQTEINITGGKDAFGMIHGSYQYYGKRLLRQDMDVAMVGEIRDKPTMDVFHRLASTGHLVFGTMHVSSAIGVPNLLIEYFNLSPLQVSDPDAFNAFINQKLANKLCTKCSISHKEHKTIVEKLLKAAIQNGEQHNQFFEKTRLKNIKQVEDIFPDDWGNFKYRNENGCSACKKIGYSGKTVLAEILMLDDTLRSFIEKRQNAEMIAYLKKIGFPTVKDHAIYALKKGIIDIHEAIKEVGQLDSKDEKEFNYADLRSDLGMENIKND